MDKNIIYFIGHEFHQKTLSAKFFYDYLIEYYNINFIWTNGKKYKKDIDYTIINKVKNLDAIIFWQIFPEIDELIKINNKNIILIPMYDNNTNLKFNLQEWTKYYNYKFINFSKNIYKKLDYLGFKYNINLQYFPLNTYTISTKSGHNSKKPKIFFWQRANEINWTFIKKIIDFEQIETFHIHKISNDSKDIQNDNKPSEIEIQKYNITFSDWFISKEEYLNRLNEYDIVIAPRLFEGIGMSFLEAMSLGKCIIAADFPTMNEYIIDKKDGYLFNYFAPELIDLTNWKTISKNVLKKSNLLRKKWEENKHKILEIIKAPIDIQNNYNKYINTLSSVDNIEKFIFEDIKTVYYLYQKPNNNYITISGYLSNLSLFIKNYIKKDKKYIIYGAGSVCEVLIKLIDSNNILYIIDSDISKHFTKLGIYDIYPVNYMPLKYQIIISPIGRFKEISSFLHTNYKIPYNQMISLDLLES